MSSNWPAETYRKFAMCNNNKLLIFISPLNCRTLQLQRDSSSISQHRKNREIFHENFVPNLEFEGKSLKLEILSISFLTIKSPFFSLFFLLRCFSLFFCLTTNTYNKKKIIPKWNETKTQTRKKNFHIAFRVLTWVVNAD